MHSHCTHVSCSCTHCHAHFHLPNKEEEPQNTRRTRGICVDYWYLDNPFPDEEDKINKTYSSNEELFAIIAGDELTSLKDAQKSLDWPEWEKAIQNELTAPTNGDLEIGW